MKKIILISIFSIVVNCLVAQEQPDLYTANLDAYVGVWEFQSDSCTFRLYLKKGKSRYWNGEWRFSHEMIFGGHHIERNGVVITNLRLATIRATDETRGENGMTISATNGKKEEIDVNPNVLSFSFTDKLKDKWARGKMTLIPGNPAQLHWQILKKADRPWIWFEEDGPPPVRHQGWTVPEDVVLTKISDTVGLEIEEL